MTNDFDRLLSAMTGLPDTKLTRPTTILEAHPMLHERNATFVVQTHRSRDGGFTVFLTVVDADGHRRIVVPPKVAAAIYRQREALVDRSTPESRKRRAAAAARAKAKADKEARKTKWANRGRAEPGNEK